MDRFTTMLRRALFGCFAIPSLYSMYGGNPADPQLLDKGFFLPQEWTLSLDGAFEGDFVGNRKVEGKQSGATFSLDEFRIGAEKGICKLILDDRYELYFSFGAMDSFIVQSTTALGMNAVSAYQTKNDFLWGGGLRIAIYSWGNATLGLQGGYQTSLAHFRWTSSNGVRINPAGTLRYKEWQVGLGVAYQFDIFSPYLTLKYSGVRGSLKGVSTTLVTNGYYQLRSRYHVGLILGCSLTSLKYFDFNVEANLIDESAISLGGNIRF